MASVREQILSYLEALVDAVAGIDAARSKQRPSTRAEGIDVVIEPVEEDVSAMPAARIRREMTVRISIRARGAVPDQIVDPVAVAITAAIMADERLGGLAVMAREVNRVWAMEEADGIAAVDAQILLLIEYRTTQASEAVIG